MEITFKNKKNKIITLSYNPTDNRLFLPDDKRLHKVYTSDIFCENGQCLTINNDGAIFSRGGHLTNNGAKMILKKIF